MGRPRRHRDEYDAESDQILKGRVAAMRRAGQTFQTIARKLGVPANRLQTLMSEWLRQELGADREVGRFVVELAVSRLEDVVRKLYPHVCGKDADVTGPRFKGLAELLLKVLDQQARMVRPGAYGTLAALGDAVPDGAEFEEELRRAGIA